MPHEVRLLLFKRQFHTEGRALTRYALDRYLTMVRVDDLVGDGQAESVAVGALLSTGLIGTVKARVKIWSSVSLSMPIPRSRMISVRVRAVWLLPTDIVEREGLYLTALSSRIVANWVIAWGLP